jgi:hypothetical protein
MNNRIDRILRRSIKEFDLDLSGLTVFTEAATGSYLYTPILAALAGAEMVYAVTSASSYGPKEQTKEQTIEAARAWGVASKIEVIFEKTRDALERSDIITNSGFVRPIDSRMVSCMKETAVIPLMWETWEFREGEVDLQACKAREILVLGTDESTPPYDLRPYGGYIAMKLLFEMGLEGYKTKTLLLGGGAGMGRSIHTHFERLEMEVDWFSDMYDDSFPYSQLAEHFSLHGESYDAVILAEHASRICLLGQGGLLDYDLIKRKNPALCIGVISGNIDVEGLQNSGLRFFPKTIRRAGYMSYQASDLGPLPVLDLYAAGLKVGQEMARARRAGATIREAAAHALKHAPAMDFEGDMAWL